MSAVATFYAQLSAGDTSGALARLDPEIEWHEPEHSLYGPGRPLRGREEVADLWRALSRDWEELAGRIVRYRGFADTLALNRALGRPGHAAHGG